MTEHDQEKDLTKKPLDEAQKARGWADGPEDQGDPEAKGDKKTKKEKKKKTVWQEILSWVLTLVAAVAIALPVRMFLFEPVRTPLI